MKRLSIIMGLAFLIVTLSAMGNKKSFPYAQFLRQESRTLEMIAGQAWMEEGVLLPAKQISKYQVFKYMTLTSEPDEFSEEGDHIYSMKFNQLTGTCLDKVSFVWMRDLKVENRLDWVRNFSFDEQSDVGSSAQYCLKTLRDKRKLRSDRMIASYMIFFLMVIGCGFGLAVWTWKGIDTSAKFLALQRIVLLAWMSHEIRNLVVLAASLVFEILKWKYETHPRIEAIVQMVWMVFILVFVSLFV